MEGMEGSSCRSNDNSEIDDSGMVELQLGNYTISVDNGTAIKLQTDSAFAEQYLNLIESQFPVEQNNPNKDAKREVKLWRTSKCQTKEDNEATLELLRLRKLLNNDFKNKKTPKNKLWSKIATVMNSKGYFVGEDVKGRERCRQKFANLQSANLICVDKKKKTGEGKVTDCPYFSKIEEIMGDKHLTNPILLIDTLTAESGSSTPSPKSSSPKPTDDVFTSSSTASSSTTNRFENIRRTVRPKKETVLEKILEMNSQYQQNRKREFDEMMGLMREQNNQRHDQILALIASLNKKSKKKERSKSSSSSEGD